MSDDGSVGRFLDQRATPCLARLAQRFSWAATLALRISDSDVGIRVDSSRTAALLDAWLEPHRVPDLDALAPPNFSLRLARDSRDQSDRAGPRDLNLIFHNHEVVARRGSQAEILRDLVALLEGTTYPTQRQHLAVRGSAVVSESGDVTLLPASWHRLLVAQRRRLTAAHGLDLLPGDVHLVDCARGTLTTVPSIAAADRWPAQDSQIVSWGVRHRVQEPCRLSRAQGVIATVLVAANLKVLGPAEVLEKLALLSTGIGFVALPAVTATSAVARAAALVDSPPLMATAVGGIRPSPGQ